jgi:hypothetical protein
MALQVQFFRVDNRYLRVVTADSQGDQDSATNIPPGTTLYRTDTQAAWRWNGTAWESAAGGGTPGPMGPAGPTGPAGSNGIDGATGPQGPQGDAGAAGSAGATGPQGLQGDPGSPGSQGIQGIQGVQGPAGNNGSPGAPGLGFGAIVKLSADLAAFTATALADATGLSFAVLANRSYSFQFWIRFSSAATTTGAQFAVNAPANSYIVYRTETSLTAAAAGAPTFRTAIAVNTGTASASVNAANANMLAIIQGMVRPSADGTLIVRCGTEVAASGITVRSGSCGVLYDFGA